MKNLRKVFLVKLPNGKITFIPLEEISNCFVIAPNKKLGLWVHEKTYPGGIDGIDDDVRVKNLDDETIETILKNGGECFVEVDYKNELKMPSNGLGHKKVVLFLNNSEK